MKHTSIVDEETPVIGVDDLRRVSAAPARPALERARVIGLPVVAGTMSAVVRQIVEAARERTAAGVCVANVHMLTTARADAGLRDILERASLVVSDGRPLVWELRRQGFDGAEQVRGPDLFVALCGAAADAGLPVYFYGGDDALIGELTDRMRQRFPTLGIAGAKAPPMLPARPPVDPETVAHIRDSGARLVFVGLGCPKQEYWMAAHEPHLDAVLVGVGQAFAIAAGRTGEAPAWMRRHGLEWFYRLYLEPRRLWRRYLLTNSLFLGFLLRERLGGLFGRREVGPPKQLHG